MTDTDRIAALRLALTRWKCPACGGKGTYRQRTRVMVPTALPGARRPRPDKLTWGEDVPCKVCKGRGLHPVAIEALDFTAVAPCS